MVRKKYFLHLNANLLNKAQIIISYLNVSKH